MHSLNFIFRTWRRLSLVTLALLLLGTGANAGHKSPLPLTQFGLIGFSDNGRYLAYETFGLYGPEGLGSAAVYVLDLAERRWVIGSPVVASATEPTQTLAELRDTARQRADFLIEDLHISRPAVLAAMIGDSAPSIDAQSLSFGVPPHEGDPVTEPFTLDIAAFDVQAAAPCDQLMDGSPRGFSLSIAGFGQNSSIYEDGPLPRSRGCPDDYRLLAVVVPFEAEDMTHAVALISVRNVSADGVQRSFVAVPIGVPGRGMN